MLSFSLLPSGREGRACALSWCSRWDVRIVRKRERWSKDEGHRKRERGASCSVFRVRESKSRLVELFAENRGGRTGLKEVEGAKRTIVGGVKARRRGQKECVERGERWSIE